MKTISNFIYGEIRRNKKGEKVIKFLPKQIIKYGKNEIKSEDLPEVVEKLNGNLGDIIAVKSLIYDKHHSKVFLGDYREYVVFRGKLKSTETEAVKRFKVFFPEFIPKRKLLDDLLDNPALKPPELKYGFYISYDLWYLLLRQVIKHKQVLLVGPSGVGKTELVYIMVEKLRQAGYDLNLSVFDMAVQNAEASFKGTLQIEDGKSYFRYSRFAKTVQKENQLILLDELNRGDVAVQNIIMPLLDNRRTLYVERGEIEEIKVPDSTFFWATANVGFGFAGAGAIDEAVEQRFLVIHIDYLPEDKEIQILKVRTGISLIAAEKIVEVANKIRKDENFMRKPSTRVTLQAAELVADGWSLRQAISLAFYSIFATLDMQTNSKEYYNRLKGLIDGTV